MIYWKCELTWHDHATSKDRRFRDVVKADTIDQARLAARDTCIKLGLFKPDTVFALEAQPFDDLELYDIRHSTKNFLRNRFKPFETDPSK